MKQTKVMKRVLLVLLTLVLLVGCLSSCGSSVKLDTVKKAGDGNGCQVYFTRILTLEGAEAAREAFVAASRGYNVLAEGFDDAKVGTENDPKDPNAEVYTTADGTGYTISMDGARAAVNLLKPNADDKNVSDADVAVFDAEVAAMTAADVAVIVEMMRGDTAVDLSGNSFPGVILEWVGAFLRLLTNITGGYYVWALFFFAIVVEIVLLYFGIKQQKTAQKQASLQPKEMAIRKKYAGRKDQKSMQALNQELMNLRQEEGVNMFGGCLPLLIQMPIILALYNIVINPLRYVLGKGEGIVNAVNKFATTSRAAGGLGLSIADANRGSIELLSQIDDPNKLAAIRDFAWFSNGDQIANELSDVAGNLPNFSMFGINTGLTPGFQKPYLLLLIPVLTFVAYFFSMKLTRKLSYQPAMAQDAQMGCSNNMMDIMMPLMSVYITFITPAAVGIYWIFKCIITTIKQVILHKAMPMPVFTEEDYKRAEREMKGKLRPEERAPLAGRPTGAKKSLHSIDDEDDLPARRRERDFGEEEDSVYERRAKETAQKQAQETAKRLEAAKLKSDRKNNKKK